MLKTVFLDAGGVLIYPGWARIAETMGRHGVTVEAAALAAAEPFAKKQIDDLRTVGNTTDAARGWMYFDLILEGAGVERSDEVGAALADLHEFHRRHNLWEYIPPHVPPALAALRARGLRLAIVSNANGTLCAHLERLGLGSLVDCVLDSYDIGVEKPDPRIFHIALERSGAERDTTIHVGDFYQADVAGARAAGIRPVLLDEGGLYEGVDCARVRSLDELVERIAGGEFDNS
jgi:putative hydrolase of the HAD superfamily